LTNTDNLTINVSFCYVNLPFSAKLAIKTND